MGSHEIRNDPRATRQAFADQMQKYRERAGTSSVGLRAVAQDLFGPSVLKDVDGKKQVVLNLRQLKVFATQPELIEEKLRTHEAKIRGHQNLPSGLDAQWSVELAARELSRAAKKALDETNVSMSSGPHESKHGKLTVATFNIKSGMESSIREIAKAINQMNPKPDVIGLQEVDAGYKFPKGGNQAKRLAELTGMHFAFAPAMKNKTGGYGNAILSKYPIKQTEAVDLPYVHRPDGGRIPGHEPRSLLTVHLKIGDRLVPVSTTHLSHRSSAERQRQNRVVMQSLPKDGIYLGDWNADNESAVYKALNRKYEDAWDRYGNGPRQNGVDHIFMDDDTFITQRAYIARKLHGTSDHEGRVAQLRFR